MWEWFWDFTTGWSRSDYFSVIVVIVPIMAALIIVTVITRNWQKRFLRLADLNAHVVFWLLFGLFVGVGALIVLRYVFPLFEIAWLTEVPH